MAREQSSRTAIDAAWARAAIGIILVATLPPQPEWQGADQQLFAFLLPRAGIEWFDVAQNLALYAPLGLALAAREHSWLRILSAAAALSFATELLQFAVPGRSPAVRDLVVNTAGAMAGALTWWTPFGRAIGLLLSRIERWLQRARHPDVAAATLSVAWAVAVVVVLAATAALLHPAPPRFRLAVASPDIDVRPGPLRIGSNGGERGSFKGLVDEVQIFNRARRASQIQTDMSSSAAVAADGLVAAFSFDTDGGAVAPDDSGHGRDGAVRGAVWTAHGRHGGAMAFDGVSSVVEVPQEESLDLRDAMTLEAWIRPSDGRAHEPAIVSHAGNVYYIEQSSPFQFSGGGRFGGVARYARTVEPVPRDEWTHLATTYDGQVIRFYINGELAASQVHWSPHRAQRTVLNGVDVHPGRAADPEVLRRALAGHIDLNTTLRCGELSGAWSPVFLIEGLRDEEQVLALNASGADIAIRPWTWARAVGLTSPPVVVPEALSGCAPGQTVLLTVNGRLQRPSLVRDGQTLASLTPGLGSAWAFVFHAELLPRWLQLAATVTWLALLALPLGLWGRRTAFSALALALVGGACFAVPAFLDIRPLSTLEAGALLAGGAVGAICHRQGARTRVA